jgi:Mrp family chromosome partitioning ATPase/capsular polysaccharide biosynthesis protein
MNETTEATAILAPLWKRKWLILAVGLLVAAGTYAYYNRKTAVYSTTTQLYLGNGAEEQGLLNGADRKAAIPNAANQTNLINSALVHEAVVLQLRSQNTPAATAASHGVVKAKSAEKSQFITISAEARSPRAVTLLANVTAQTYVKRETSTYQREVKAAIALTRAQLARVEAGLVQAATAPKGKGGKASVSPTATLQAASLSTKINQLESDLSIVNVKQIGIAKPYGAQLVSPKPRKNAIFGFAIGILLASIAAYTLSRFDRRLRSLADIEAIFQTPILTALPTVRRPIVGSHGTLVPSRFLQEPLRRLHTTLQLAETPNRDRDGAPRSILFVSADAGDGKSTLAATLALVQRDAGERVAVVEADFRRPVQAKLLGVPAPRGLVDVLSGTLSLDEAMQAAESIQQSPSTNSGAPAASVATAVESRGTGTLSVLVGGKEVANPPALLANRAMTELLRAAAEDFDYVLIDAPPPLQVSDVMPLLPVVDGIVLIARLGHTRQSSAQQLMQLLTRTANAPILGVVANDVARKDIERYGYSASQGKRGWLSGLTGR